MLYKKDIVNGVLSEILYMSLLITFLLIGSSFIIAR